MALLLKRRGFTRIHPLEGGLPQWIALGFPVSDLPASAIPVVAIPGAESSTRVAA